jgi:haloalkane dehalogenase
MIRKAYIDTPSGVVHYRIAGPHRAPPVLFLHQNTSSSWMFEHTMAALAADIPTIAMDLPGFGGSYDPPDFDSISALTDAVIETIDALGIPGAARLRTAHRRGDRG